MKVGPRALGESRLGGGDLSNHGRCCMEYPSGRVVGKWAVGLGRSESPHASCYLPAGRRDHGESLAGSWQQCNDLVDRDLDGGESPEVSRQMRDKYATQRA